MSICKRFSASVGRSAPDALAWPHPVFTVGTASAPLKLSRPHGAMGIHLLLHCALAAAQCIVIGPVCEWVCLFVCLWVSGSVTTITRNYVHRSAPNCMGL